jgi:FlaA1/EpsC-like NDP-sugar epimerase
MVRLSGLREGDDIEIQFTGVRPGEKLFEELHIDGEMHVNTTHPKIMVAKCQETPLDEITSYLNRFQLASGWEDETIVAELERVVPEFQPTRFGPPDGGAARRAA